MCATVPAMSGRRVVVTGLGLVTPLAVGVEATWAALLAGKSGVGTHHPLRSRQPGDPHRRRGEGLRPLQWMDRKDARHTDRFVHFALAATEMAVRASGLVIGSEAQGGYEPERVGVILGSGSRRSGICGGGAPEGAPGGVRPARRPVFVLQIIYQHRRGHGEHSLRRGGAQLGSGRGLLHRGARHRRGAVVDPHRPHRRDDRGAAEAAITPLGIGGFEAMRALSVAERRARARRAVRSTADRDGFVLGEGAGVLVLEEPRARAARAGRRSSPSVLGYAANADAHHLTQPTEDGARRASLHAPRAPGRRSRARATSTTSTPTGPSTPLNDVARDARALKTAFGAHATEARGELHQVDDRASARRGGKRRGRVQRARARRGGGSADASTSRRRIRSAIWTTFPTSPGSRG